MENVPLALFFLLLIYRLTEGLHVFSVGPVRLEFYERRKRDTGEITEAARQVLAPPPTAECEGLVKQSTRRRKRRGRQG
jgi:hypothetical protein